jgi:hypothetical protein
MTLTDQDVQKTRISRFGDVILKWILFSIGVSVLIRPILTTAIVADDFIGPFSQFHQSGAGLISSLRFGYNAASYGHFNYVGQIIGALANWIWMQLQGQFGIRYSTIYATSKFLVILFAISQAARLSQRILTTDRSSSAIWKLRIAIALALAATIQLHIVWSNDPVGSYPLSGYLSAAIGMMVLNTAFSFFTEKTVRNFVVLTFILIGAILYYEMNIALLASVGILALVFEYRNKSTTGNFIKPLAISSAALVFPTAITFFLQFHNSAESASYAGTAVALNGKSLQVFGNSLVSSLPFSSWHLAFDWLPNGVTIRAAIFIFPMFGALLFSAIIYRHGSRRRTEEFSNHLLLIAPLLTYWIFATLIQCATVKVQNEATRIGSVYNFYAVGSLVIAVIIGLAGIFFFERFTSKVVRILVSIFIVLACIGQFAINDTLATRHAGYLVYNRNLLVQFVDGPTTETRCLALEQWLTMGWPGYYLNEMTVGVEAAYKHFNNEIFCGRL